MPAKKMICPAPRAETRLTRICDKGALISLKKNMPKKNTLSVQRNGSQLTPENTCVENGPLIDHFCVPFSQSVFNASLSAKSLLR